MGQPAASTNGGAARDFSRIAQPVLPGDQRVGVLRKKVQVSRDNRRFERLARSKRFAQRGQALVQDFAKAIRVLAGDRDLALPPGT